MEATVTKRTNILIALTLIGIAVLLRVLPHPPNFAPVAAIALFGGAVLPRRYAVITPLAIMILSDLIIGLHSLILVTWGAYALIALAGSKWLRKPTIFRGVNLVISGSLFFFAITNFAVWLEGSLYPRTIAGLQRCFVLALPFFRNTFLSDIVYATALFGSYALATQASRYLLKTPKSTE